MGTVTNEQAATKIAEFAKEQLQGFFPCPRCGRMVMNEKPTRNALSRYADVYVCDECGMDEAIRDFGRKPLPLADWSVVKDWK